VTLRWGTRLPLCVALLGCWASIGPGLGGPLVPLAEAALQLRPESDLTSSCYDFPNEDFGRDNSVKNTYGSSPHVLLAEGDSAIDFTLPTITGELVNLKALLEVKPVLLLWGHYTCPAYQGLNSETMFIGKRNLQTRTVSICGIYMPLCLFSRNRIIVSGRVQPYSLTVADLYLYLVLTWAPMNKVDLEPYPNVLAWFNGIKTNPRVQSGHTQMATNPGSTN
jgi:hypothetical protein